jgi:hypothetical protein
MPGPRNATESSFAPEVIHLSMLNELDCFLPEEPQIRSARAPARFPRAAVVESRASLDEFLPRPAMKGLAVAGSIGAAVVALAATLYFWQPRQDVVPPQTPVAVVALPVALPDSRPAVPEAPALSAPVTPVQESSPRAAAEPQVKRLRGAASSPTNTRKATRRARRAR